MEYKKAVVEAGKKMLDKGLTVETFGNISIYDRKNSLVYISPSGMPYYTLEESDIPVLSIDGGIVDGRTKPSIETGLHLALYRARPDVSAVVHTHSIYSCVFAAMDKEIPLFHDEAVHILRDTVRVAEYATAGSESLAQNCVNAIGDEARACLLKAHGAVCVAENIDECFKVTVVLEMMAQIYQLALSAGGQCRPLSKENITHIRHFSKTVYGK